MFLVTEPVAHEALHFWTVTWSPLRASSPLLRRVQSIQHSKNGAPPPRSGLAEREPFCLQPRKKSTKRTSLGTNREQVLDSTQSFFFVVFFKRADT